MKTIDCNLILGQPGTQPGGVLTLHDLIGEMDRQEIQKGWVTHLAGSIHNTVVGNRLLRRAMQEAGNVGGRLRPVPVLDLERVDGGLDWQIWEGLGANGVRACPAFYGSSTHPQAIQSILERLSAKGWFLQIPVAPFCGSRWQTGTVAGAVILSKRNPDIPLIVLCPGRRDFAALCLALESCPNLYVDVGNLTTGVAVSDLVSRGFTGRLVYGSGFGVSCSTPSRDVTLYAPISYAAQEAILYQNAERLFVNGEIR